GAGSAHRRLPRRGGRAVAADAEGLARPGPSPGRPAAAALPARGPRSPGPAGDGGAVRRHDVRRRLARPRRRPRPGPPRRRLDPPRHLGHLDRARGPAGPLPPLRRRGERQPRRRARRQGHRPGGHGAARLAPRRPPAHQRLPRRRPHRPPPPGGRRPRPPADRVHPAGDPRLGGLLV
ncbi:MAG: FIG024784: Integral membrane protein related to pyrimidine synthesis, partial [uncultured Frankineae bacterium]